MCERVCIVYNVYAHVAYICNVWQAMRLFRLYVYVRYLERERLNRNGHVFL